MMGKKIQSQKITDIGVMVNGIKSHQDVLSQRKINETFANELQAKIDVCIALNKEQETLKAKLKEKTAAFNAAMDTMQKQAGEARKIIKLDIPQELWREFGINDKR